MSEREIYGEAPSPVWLPFTKMDLALNDSSKDFVVPAGEVWEIDAIYVDYAASSDAGNRLPGVQYLTDATPTAVITIMAPFVNQAADAHYYYNFAQGLIRSTAVYGTSYLDCPLPDAQLEAGQIIRVLDTAAIAAAADDMKVTIKGRKRSV